MNTLLNAVEKNTLHFKGIVGGFKGSTEVKMNNARSDCQAPCILLSTSIGRKH